MKKIFLLGLISCFSFPSFAALQTQQDSKEGELVLGEEDQKPAEAHTKDSLSKSKMQIEMRMDFLAGTRVQRHLQSYEKFLSHEKKNIAFDTATGVKIIYSNELENFGYGGVAVLTPTGRIATSSVFNGTYIFFSTEYGIMKLGSPNDAGSELRITGGDKTVGGEWRSFVTLNPNNSKYFGMPPEFETGNSYYMSSYKTKVAQINDGTEFARKISFLTPEVLEGLRAGVSYTPDSRNTGGIGFGRDERATSGIYKINISKTETWRINTNVKDAFAVGLSARHIFDEVTSVEVATTAEFAKASGDARLIQNEGTPNATVLQRAKLKDLQSYNIGGNFNIGNFCYALSFGTLSKSLTTPAYYKTNRNTLYYNGGITYEQGPIKTSIEYFKSNKFKNVLDVITLGTEYKVAPGLMPYAELSYLSASGRPSYYPDAPKQKIRASVFVTGLKLRVKL